MKMKVLMVCLEKSASTADCYGTDMAELAGVLNDLGVERQAVEVIVEVAADRWWTKQ